MELPNHLSVENYDLLALCLGYALHSIMEGTWVENRLYILACTFVQNKGLDRSAVDAFHLQR